MPDQKEGFTLERHEQIGTDLQKMHVRLVQIENELREAYPPDVSEMAKRSWLAILELRNALDKIVCQEYPDEKKAGTLYFGIRSPD